DVSHYVSPDSALERAALKRGTATYLGETILPLLPAQLTNQIGALLPGQDRLTLSLLLTLNAAGDVLEFEIQPSVIQVDYQLTYPQVEAILQRAAGLPEDLQELAPVFEQIDQLQALAVALKQQRHQHGGFELSLSAPRFHHFDDEGLLGVMVASPDWQARLIVEEFMVLANQKVATHLKALGVPAIYRIQPIPDLYNVQELIKLANNLSLELSLAQEDSVQPQDYQNFVEKFATSETAPILNQLLVSTLKPGSYSLTSGPHFGLILAQDYAHFTSPLRRYADVLNQRVLQAVFAKGRDRRTTRAKEKVNLHHSSCHGQITWNVLPPEIQRDLEASLTATVHQLNEREKITQQAEQDLEGLQKAKQMQARTGEIFR
ncbi:MAG TPA: ribonuclease catalytic domain-containing protein, partial [Candidatus Caenarcaniphilales bacterium]